MKTGVQVVDEGLKPVGRVFDVFGPVKNPYVSVEPSIDELERCIGRPLYVMEKR